MPKQSLDSTAKEIIFSVLLPNVSQLPKYLRDALFAFRRGETLTKAQKSAIMQEVAFYRRWIN